MDKFWFLLFNDNILLIFKGDEQLAKRRQKFIKQDRVKFRRIEELEGMIVCLEVFISNYYFDEFFFYNQLFFIDNFFFKSEMDDDDYSRILFEEYRMEIQNLEEQYAAVFDQSYNETQYKKLIESFRSVNDLFNLTDIFIRRLIKFVKYVLEFKQF